MRLLMMEGNTLESQNIAKKLNMRTATEIYKKALLNSDFVNESELLESIRPLLNTETLWKPHGLLLLGDYFVSKKEYIKAVEFYQKIFTIKNLQKDLYNHAGSQLAMIENE